MSAPIDEQYTLDAQDPNDPVWATDADIAEMPTEAEDPTWESTPHVRNSGGVIEFLNDIEETVEEFLKDDPGPGPKIPKLDPIRTREAGSDKWRGRSAVVTASMTSAVLNASPSRRRVTIVNYGPNTVYLASVGNGTPGAPNMFPLIASATVAAPTVWAPMVIETADDVWAVCLAAQTATLGLIEEFDFEA